MKGNNMADRKSFLNENLGLPFKEGQRIHRQRDLHDRFGGKRQSGIAPCAKHPFIFLFTSTSGDEFGYQDGWRSEDEYFYTGEGQIGNMKMTRGNLAIQNHQEDGRALHLFKKVSLGYYEYVGPFEYLRHEISEGFDAQQQKRDAIRFFLRKVNKTQKTT